MAWVKKILDLRIKRPNQDHCFASSFSRRWRKVKVLWRQMMRREVRMTSHSGRPSGCNGSFAITGTWNPNHPARVGWWHLLQGNRSQESQLGQVSGDQADQASPSPAMIFSLGEKFVGWKARMVLGLISGFQPGWHIECSVMATDKNGAYLDIHAGGDAKLEIWKMRNELMTCWLIEVQFWKWKDWSWNLTILAEDLHEKFWLV